MDEKELQDITLPDELMELVAGGKLPTGWQKTADAMVPGLRKQYPNIKTFAQAQEVVRKFVKDPDDQQEIFNYMRKYF